MIVQYRWEEDVLQHLGGDWEADALARPALRRGLRRLAGIPDVEDSTPLNNEDALARDLHWIQVKAGRLIRRPLFADRCLITLTDPEEETSVLYINLGPNLLRLDAQDIRLVLQQKVQEGQRPPRLKKKDEQKVLTRLDGIWSLDPEHRIFLTAWDPGRCRLQVATGSTRSSRSRISLQGGPEIGWTVASGAGLRLTLEGLGFPRSLHELLAASLKVPPGSASQSVGLQPLGILDLSQVSLQDPPPEAVTVHVEPRDPTDGESVTDWAHLDTDLPIATDFRGIKAVVEGGVAEIVHTGQAIQALQLSSHGPAPHTLTVQVEGLSTPRTLVLQRQTRQPLRYTGDLSCLTEDVAAPVLLSFHCRGQDDVIGHLAASPSSQSGSWRPEGSDRLYFTVQGSSGEDLASLARPSIGPDGLSRFEVTPSPAASCTSGIWWQAAELEQPGHRIQVNIPLTRDAPHQAVRMASDPRTGGQAAALELACPPAFDPIDRVECWIPGSESSVLSKIQVLEGGRFRLPLDPRLEITLEKRALRLWICSEHPTLRLSTWIHAVGFPDRRDWLPCETDGQGTIQVPPDGPLFVDFRGLTGNAAIAVLNGTGSVDYSALILDRDSRWSIDGGDRVGPDGASLAPIQAAFKRQELAAGTPEVHLWLQETGDGTGGLEHLVARQVQGGRWCLEAGPDKDPSPFRPFQDWQQVKCADEDTTGQILPLLDSIPGHGSWLLRWRHYLFEVVEPDFPRVYFRGWIWPQTSHGRFPAQVPHGTYGFSISWPDSPGVTFHGSMIRQEIRWRSPEPPGSLQRVVSRRILQGPVTDGVAVSLDTEEGPFRLTAAMDPQTPGTVNLTLQETFKAAKTTGSGVRIWHPRRVEPSPDTSSLPQQGPESP